METKAAYKIEEINRFWKFQVYRRTCFGWWKYFGRDSISSCEEELKSRIERRNGLYYDAAGNRLPNDSKGE